MGHHEGDISEIIHGHVDTESMTDQKLTDKIARLRKPQQAKVEELVNAFTAGTDNWINPKSDFATEQFAASFSDDLIFNHLSSTQPLTKDKFEYAMVSSFNEIGHSASKTISNTYPGQDITVDEHDWSLKTEAAKNIKRDEIHISKFMELGKGAWETVADLERMRQRMFDHMTRYERIFTLRCFRTPINESEIAYEYELVEIPKSVLLMANGQPITFHKTKQLTAAPHH